MSEISFTEPIEPNRSEVPSYSPADIREIKTYEVLDNDAQAANVEAMWQFYQPIPEDAIETIMLHDETIRDHYETTLLELGEIENFVENFHDRIVEATHKFITEKELEFAEWYKQQETAKNLTITAIEEEFNRRVQRVNADKMISDINSNEIIDKTNTMLESNSRVITNIRRILEGGIKAQTQHESRRSNAIETKNYLIAEYERFQIALEKAQKGLGEYRNNLSKSEARREELMDEEDSLKADERLERERVAAPSIMAVGNQLGFDDESHEGYREYIRNVRNAASSPELSEILGNIAIVNEKQRHNDRNINNNIGLIDSTELTIARNTEELNKIAHRIEEVSQKLADELDNVLPALEIHSDKYQKVVQQLYAMNRENTAAIARDTNIPALLSPVSASVRSVQIALARANNDTRAKEWPEPKFDTTLMPLLPLDPSDEPFDITAASERIENADKLSQNLEQIKELNIVGIIGRGFRKAGAKINYRTNPTTMEN